MSRNRSHTHKLILGAITLATICIFVYIKEALTNQPTNKQTVKIQIPIDIEKSVSASIQAPQPASQPDYKLIDLSPTDSSEDVPESSNAEVDPFEEQIGQLVDMMDEKAYLDPSDLTAIEIFISRLPDNLSQEELNMLGKYINTYQANHAQASHQLNSPEHIGDSERNLGMIVTRLYSQKHQQIQLPGSIDPSADSEQLLALNKQIVELTQGRPEDTSNQPEPEIMSDEPIQGKLP